MAEINTACKCDECKTETFDYMADAWITIKGELTAYKGRGADGCASADRYVNSQHKVEHFCSWECLTKGRFPKPESRYKSRTPAADALLKTPNPTAEHIRASLIELTREVGGIREWYRAAKAQSEPAT